uniref:Uncharacterized protein n=1 Tax=Arundo donax TaxID=35708 RepID=A0A0A9G559_ARUDO
MLVHPPPVLRCLVNCPVGPDVRLGLFPCNEDLLHLCHSLRLESEAVYQHAPLAKAVVKLAIPVVALHLVKRRVAEPQSVKALYAVQTRWWRTTGRLGLLFWIHNPCLVPSRRSRSSQAAALPCPALLAPCPSWRLPWPRTRRGQEPGLCCAARRHRHAQAPWSRRRTWFPRLAPASRRLREAGRLPHLAARALAEPPPPLAG